VACNQQVTVRNLDVRMVPIDQLMPYISNSRAHTGEQVALVAASIREFGWTNPILIRPDKAVIAGHARLLAARKLGFTEVPTIELAGMREAQCRALAIADNELAITGAGCDKEMLRIGWRPFRRKTSTSICSGTDSGQSARSYDQTGGANTFITTTLFKITALVPASKACCARPKQTYATITLRGIRWPSTFGRDGSLFHPGPPPGVRSQGRRTA
jgi:hypothetical protein